MPAPANTKRLVDQIEIIRDRPFPPRVTKGLLDECLQILDECTKQLHEVAQGPLDHEVSTIERHLERFQRQSRILQRVMTRYH